MSRSYIESQTWGSVGWVGSKHGWSSSYKSNSVWSLILFLNTGRAWFAATAKFVRALHLIRFVKLHFNLYKCNMHQRGKRRQSLCCEWFGLLKHGFYRRLSLSYHLPWQSSLWQTACELLIATWSAGISEPVPQSAFAHVPCLGVSARSRVPTPLWQHDAQDIMWLVVTVNSM